MIRWIMVILLFIGCLACQQQKEISTATPMPESPPTPIWESRGIWLDKSNMFDGREELLAMLDQYQEAGFNAIYVAMQIQGCVMYPDSELLPQYPIAKEKDPQILDWLIPEIKKRGMRAEAWTEYGFYTYHTPQAGADESRGPIVDRYPELVAMDQDGQEHLHNPEWGDFYSLCPSNPKAQDVLIQLYDEMMERFDFDGLNLDRIRYPDERYCYCGYCREHFKRDTGLELMPFEAGTSEHASFMQWRKDQLNQFMERFSSGFRSRFPGKKITSAVVPPYMLEDKGQDWMTWLQRGYLDAAMPMLYARDISASVQATLDVLGDEPLVFYGLDAGQGKDIFVEQVHQLREIQAHGLTVWYSGSLNAFVQEVGKELFSEPALSPLYDRDE